MFIFRANVALIRVSHEICDKLHLYVCYSRREVHHSYLLTLINVCYRSTHGLVYYLLEWVVQATCNPLPNRKHGTANIEHPQR